MSRSPADEPASSAAIAATVTATMVWDWPLRLWHWAFALSVVSSLYTGWSGDIALMDWHLRLGYCALGLLAFRLCWALWGGRYARLASFRFSPRQLIDHFRGLAPPRPRTAPGVLLVAGLLGLVALQAGSGLFTSDEIFTEGPLVRHADDDTVDLLSSVHHNLKWGVAGLIGVHLLAHVIYALRRDPTPLAMFTGRKPLALPPARNLPLRALLTAVAVTAAVWWGLSLA